MNVLISVMAGFLAAFISYFLNGRALKLLGEDAVTCIAPVIEEVSKTGLAFFLGGNILFSHVAFGFAEALYDTLNNRGVLQYTAAITGLISHVVFGTITLYTWRSLGSLPAGIFFAIIIHMLWNHLIIRIKVKR